MNDFADSEELFEQKNLHIKTSCGGFLRNQGAKLAFVLTRFASIFVIAATVRARITRIAAF